MIAKALMSAGCGEEKALKALKLMSCCAGLCMQYEVAESNAELTTLAASE